MRHLIVFTSIALLAPLMQACAPAVVAGAATATAVATGDPRSTSTLVNDKGIEVRANDLIYSDRDLGTQVHVNVASYNNVVLLTGEAPSEEVRGQVEAMVRRIEGVRQIHNEITIGPSTSLESRSNDAWLTAQVKGWMVRSGKVSASRIKVVTERATVYLMGIVTPDEAKAASDIARQVGGVERVVELLNGGAATPASTAPVAPQPAPAPAAVAPVVLPAEPAPVPVEATPLVESAPAETETILVPVQTESIAPAP